MDQRPAPPLAFEQNEALGRHLRSTSPAVIVEASPHDRIWGIGLSAGEEGARTPSLGGAG